MISSGHVVADCSGSVTGTGDIHQPDSTTSKIGNAIRGWNSINMDYAIVDIDISQSGDLTYYIAADSDDTYKEPIYGKVTWDKINEIMNNYEYIEFQRKESGRLGSILITDTASNSSGDVQYFYTNNKVLNGDSGGPFFEVKSGEAYIAGELVAEADQDGDRYYDDAKATAMSGIENDDGYISVGNADLTVGE